MRKKLITLLLATFLFMSFKIIIKSADTPLGETIVSVSNKAIDLPASYVLDAQIRMYEYGGVDIYDFREYFEILDNGDYVLRVIRIMKGDYDITDRGGYEWDFGGFDHEQVGDYQITLTYTSEFTGQTKSATVNLNVIEQDLTPPIISGMSSGFFNIVKTDLQFEEELKTFINFIEIYDYVDGLIDVSVELFDGLDDLRNANLNDKIDVTLNAVDNAGNQTTRTVTLTVVDKKAPYILNLKTIVVKKGKTNADIKSHVIVIDNYDDEVIPVFEYFGNVIYENIWEIVTDQTRLKGKPIEVLTEEMTEEEALLYAQENYLSGYSVGNYISFNKAGARRAHYIRIKSKQAQAIYLDPQTEIDFNRTGVQYVRVTVSDTAGNVASGYYRVVIENGMSFIEIALIINGIVLGIAAVGIGFYIAVIHMKKKRLKG